MRDCWLDLQREIERREEQLEAMYSDPELMKVQKLSFTCSSCSKCVAVSLSVRLV